MPAATSQQSTYTWVQAHTHRTTTKEHHRKLAQPTRKAPQHESVLDGRASAKQLSATAPLSCATSHQAQTALTQVNQTNTDRHGLST